MLCRKMLLKNFTKGKYNSYNLKTFCNFLRSQIFDDFLNSLELTPESFLPTSDPSNQTNADTFATAGLYKKNSIHLHGVEDLSTEEIFEFLKGLVLFYFITVLIDDKYFS